MGSTIVDRLYNDFDDLTTLLKDTKEISLIISAEENFKKSLLLSAASFFEKKMTDCVLDFTYETTGNRHIISSLIKIKAVNRQYHTWFKWEEKNANTFFSLFGQEFSQQAKLAVKENPRLDESIKSFLELGNARNRLVHQDFGNFTLEKTTAEIYQLYNNALFFIEWAPDFLRKNSTSTD